MAELGHTVSKRRRINIASDPSKNTANDSKVGVPVQHDLELAHGTQNRGGDNMNSMPPRSDFRDNRDRDRNHAHRPDDRFYNRPNNDRPLHNNWQPGPGRGRGRGR